MFFLWCQILKSDTSFLKPPVRSEDLTAQKKTTNGTLKCFKSVSC